MGQILAFLWAKGWFLFGPVFMFVFLLTATPYGKLWKNVSDRKCWIGDLLQNNWKARYRRIMRRILDRIDQTLSSHELKAQASPVRIAFSYGLINLSMLLAIAYPVLGFIGQWIFGTALQLGDLPIAPAGSITARIFVIFWLLIPLFLYLYVAITKPSLHLLLFISASMILFGGVFFTEQFGVPVESAGAFAVAITGNYAGAIAIAIAIAIAVVVVGNIAVLVSVAVSVTAAISAKTGALDALESVNAFAVAVVCAIVIASILTKIERNLDPKPIFRILYLLVFLITVSTVILKLDEFMDNNKTPPTYLLLFFAIFPIFNALADFTSTGLTRYLLRRGLTKPIWFNALLDTLGGLSVFFLLGFALISYIHLVRPQDGTPLLDLSTLFDQLQNNPSDFWWLALMLGSTLLPTLLHLMVGVATILIQYPAFLRNWTIRKLASGGEGSDIDGWQGSAMVCGMISLSIWLPVILFYYLFRMNHSAVINGTIWVFSSYADLIGAL